MMSVAGLRLQALVGGATVHLGILRESFSDREDKASGAEWHTG